MQSSNTDENARRPRSRLTLWLIIAVCAAPMIASYVAFYFWRPTQHVNYGELIEPRALPDVPLEMNDGRSLRLSDLRGEWMLLTSDRAACDERCRAKLIYMRQVRLAQGKETQRIERVWLVSDGGTPDPALIVEHPGLRVVAVDASNILKELPASRSPADHIYVVDPLGNLMMRFPADPDPRRMLKDVARLLRHSKWK